MFTEQLIRARIVDTVCHCDSEILAHANWLTNLECTVYILFWNSTHSMSLNSVTKYLSVCPLHNFRGETEKDCLASCRNVPRHGCAGVRESSDQ
jgi:hypothetical protein